jgi:transcription antitermination protein NusB
MSKPRNARELVLKVLFQIEVGRLPMDEVLETTFETVRPSPEDQAYVDATVRGVMGDVERLDGVIGELAEGWRLDRLAKVDKNILRAAVWELEERPEIPAPVILNDAAEIAKKYSTDDSSRFVNGILGSFLRRRSRGGEGDGGTGEGKH